MAPDARTRIELSQQLAEQYGKDMAAYLMEVVPPFGWNEIATKADLTALEERFGLRLTGEVAGLRGDLRTEMAEMRGDLRTEIADVRTEIAGLSTSFEEKLRGQTRWLSGLALAALGIGVTLARLA